MLYNTVQYMYIIQIYILFYALPLLLLLLFTIIRVINYASLGLVVVLLTPYCWQHLPALHTLHGR